MAENEKSLQEVVTARGTEAGALSPREREVLGLLVRGNSNREVALRLGVSKKSIDTYRLRLQGKLGLKGRPALVRYAISLGLLKGPSQPPPRGSGSGP